MKHKEYFGQCGYHYGQATKGLRIVQLTHNNREWQSPLAACANCLRYLKGHFRYAPKVCSGFLGLVR